MSAKITRVRLWAARHPLLAIVATIALCGGALLVVWAFWPSTAPVWSGIRTGASDTSSRTLWDWLELLIIPLALLVAAWWITKVRQPSSRSADSEVAHLGRPIESLDDRYQESRLQAYYNRIGRMLLDHGLRNAPTDDEVRKLARAQTLTVLWGLSGERKGALTRFLHEAELIANPEPVISLAGANLSSADLRGADLSDSNLRQAHLIKANLAHAHLNKTDLAEADLSGADLRGALSPQEQLARQPWTTPNLSNADLSGVVLRDAHLRGIDLTNASLSGATLSGADLQDAILTRCVLNNASLSKAKLRGSNLRSANLSHALLDGADLGEAIVVNAQIDGADLRSAQCTQANFRGSDLSVAKFAHATLVNAFMQGCDLRDADLTGANLRGANLSGADLSGARLDGADLRGAYLSTAKITAEQLSAALSFDGATLPDNSPAEKLPPDTSRPH